MKVRELMSTNVFTLDRDHNIVITEKLLKWRHIRHVPVVERDKVVGLVSHRDLLKAATSSLAGLAKPAQARRDREITVNDIMNTDIVTVSPDDDITRAATLLAKNKIGCLPVMQREKLVGILTEADFLKLAFQHDLVWDGWRLTADKGQPRYVEEVMSQEVFKLHPERRLSLLEDLMDWSHIRHVPVVDKQNHLIGMVTHRDLMKAMVSAHENVGRAEQHKMLSHFDVASIMNRNVLTTTKRTKLADAAASMFENKIGCLPVLDGKHLVGIITEADFLKLAKHKE